MNNSYFLRESPNGKEEFNRTLLDIAGLISELSEQAGKGAAENWKRLVFLVPPDWVMIIG